jgi:Amidohydrolase
MQPDTQTAVADARAANDFLAAVIGEHPGRFQGLAAVPLKDPRQAVAGLRRAVRELGLRGASSTTTRWAATWTSRASNRSGRCGRTWGSRCTSTRTPCRPANGTVVQEYPGVDFGTWVCVLPPGTDRRGQHHGIDNVMFCIDYPLEPTGQAAEFIRTAPLAPADKERVAHANAERILRLSPSPRPCGAARTEAAVRPAFIHALRQHEARGVIPGPRCFCWPGEAAIRDQEPRNSFWIMFLIVPEWVRGSSSRPT